jgi:hypothetical protein
MRIDMSCNDTIYDTVCSFNTEDILQRTATSKDTWLEMNEYLSDAETRENSTLITEPAKKVLHDCFNHLRMEMTKAVERGFSLLVHVPDNPLMTAIRTANSHFSEQTSII